MRLLIVSIISFSASLLSQDASQKNYFVIWNIGQGQWTTFRGPNECEHFDMGGEFNLIQKVSNFCKERFNFIHISHWDKDHHNFLPSFVTKNSQACLWNIPRGPTDLENFKEFEKLPLCKNLKSPLKIIYSGTQKTGATSNEYSQVVIRNQILIPGDSTTKDENIWNEHPSLLNAQGLVLGHHGSRTSTSISLLNHLPQLKWAIVSARKSRFGHPHKEVVKKLQIKKIPTLRTEEWGSIAFEL